MTVGEGPATLVFEPLLLWTRPVMWCCVVAAVEARRAGMSGERGGEGQARERSEGSKDALA